MNPGCSFSVFTELSHKYDYVQ